MRGRIRAPRGRVLTIFLAGAFLATGLVTVADAERWDVIVTIGPDQTKSNRTVEFTLTLENAGNVAVTVCRIDIKYDWDADPQNVFMGTQNIAAGGSELWTTTEAIPDLPPAAHPAIVTVTAFALPDVLCSPSNWSVPIEIVANVPPTADFSYVQLTPAPQAVVQFSDESTDFDGGIVGWRWDFGGGAFSSQRDPTHTFATAGSHPVILVVTDSDGANDTFSDIVQVAANRPPTAVFSFLPLNPDTTTEIQFTDGSSDRDGVVSQWRWDFDDGNTSTLQHPRHRFREARVYRVVLTVIDDDNSMAFHTQNVPVAAPPGGSTSRLLGLGVLEWGALGAVLAGIAVATLLIVLRRVRPSRRWGRAANAQTTDKKSRWRPR